MATEVLKRVHTGDSRIAFRASWDDYLAVARMIGDQHVLLAYDGVRVELMSPGPDHEGYKVLLDRLVWIMSEVLGVPSKGMGSTGWKRPELAKGVEADACYYLTTDKFVNARRRPDDPVDWPIPDLAVEIDISHSRIDRPSIYAALGVPEVWRFDGESFRIVRLGPDRVYTEVPESGWFGIRPEEAVLLLGMDVETDNDFAEQVRAWACDVLVPRRGRKEA